MSINSEMTNLADAIRAKSGVTGKLTISGMTDAVDGIEINQGSDIDFTGVNVTSDKMLAGTVAINAGGNKVTGNIQAVTATKDGNRVTVPSGHIASQQVVTVGTAKSAATITPGTSDQTIAADTYLSGKQTIKGDANLTAENIKSGVRIFAVTGTFEGSGGGGSGGSGAFDLAKVTNYTPYAPAMTQVTSVAVSGIGDWIYSDDPESEDYEYNQYYSEANGWYYVTSETAEETDWKKRVYKHESKEYYLYYEYYDDYPDESTWFFSTSMSSDDQFIRKYNEYDWDTDEPLPVGDLESGESEWGDYDWEPFYVTLDVRTTAIPETPMSLKGVLATGYADGEWSFASAEKSFAGFDETPIKDYMYAVDNADNMLVGSPVAYIDIFPGTSALFALDASRGTTELVNGGTPSLIGSGTVLQNGEFCFDNTRAFTYAIGSTMSALKDFTIELDFTVTSNATGMQGMFGNRTSWSSHFVGLQWGRDGYRVSLHWNGYVDGLCGGSYHDDWINDGKYHHAALVRKGSKVSIYTDGELTASSSYNANALNLAVESLLDVGIQRANNVYFPGRIKHFRVLPFAKYTDDFKLANWVGK